MTIKAFADASVLYAAIISASGGSRELLKKHSRGEIILFATEHVLEETRTNLAAKKPDRAGAVELLVDLINLQTVEVPAPTIIAAAGYTALKDAPVIAGAQAANCEYLLTFDKQHLLGKEEVTTKSGLIITTPGELLQYLREQKDMY